MKSDSVPHPSTLNVQAAGLPNSDPAQFSAPSHDLEIDTVIVQPGETLRHIILRNMGKYNGGTLERIHELNPAITNFDDIETGQVIRLPRAPLPTNSTVASEGASTFGKN